MIHYAILKVRNRNAGELVAVRRARDHHETTPRGGGDRTESLAPNYLEVFEEVRVEPLETTRQTDLRRVSSSRFAGVPGIKVA